MSGEQSRRPSFPRRVHQILVAVAIIAAGAWGALHFLWPQAGGAVTVGGPFRLQSAEGGVVDSEALTGKPYGVFFGFTHCPEVCPTTLSDLANAFTAISDLPKDFRVFFISVRQQQSLAYSTHRGKSPSPSITSAFVASVTARARCVPDRITSIT
jgi:protein SCO1/2